MSESPLLLDCWLQSTVLYTPSSPPSLPQMSLKKKKTFIHENEYFFFHNLEKGVRFMSVPQNVAFELMRVGY